MTAVFRFRMKSTPVPGDRGAPLGTWPRASWLPTPCCRRGRRNGGELRHCSAVADRKSKDGMHRDDDRHARGRCGDVAGRDDDRHREALGSSADRGARITARGPSACHGCSRAHPTRGRRVVRGNAFRLRCRTGGRALRHGPSSHGCPARARGPCGAPCASGQPGARRPTAADTSCPDGHAARACAPRDRALLSSAFAPCATRGARPARGHACGTRRCAGSRTGGIGACMEPVRWRLGLDP